MPRIRRKMRSQGGKWPVLGTIIGDLRWYMYATGFITPSRNNGPICSWFSITSIGSRRIEIWTPPLLISYIMSKTCKSLPWIQGPQSWTLAPWMNSTWQYTSQQLCGVTERSGTNAPMRQISWQTSKIISLIHSGNFLRNQKTSSKQGVFHANSVIPEEL